MSRRCECGNRKDFYAKQCRICRFGYAVLPEHMSGLSSLEQRIAARIAVKGECREWTGHCAVSSGRPQIGLGQKVAYLHRTLWEMTVGPIPEGQHVYMACSNERCIRTSHLYLDERYASPLERMAERIAVNGECREWTGTITTTQEGDRRPVISIKHEPILVYRLAWEMCFGPIPDGMMICHTCDNGICIRTSHLFVGTHLDNMRDKAAKGRCRNGYTGRLLCQ